MVAETGEFFSFERNYLKPDRAVKRIIHTGFQHLAAHGHALHALALRPVPENRSQPAIPGWLPVRKFVGIARPALLENFCCSYPQQILLSQQNGK